MVYTKRIPFKSKKNGDQYSERVLFGVYCSKEDAAYIDKSLKDIGITYGRSNFFVQAVLGRLEELGYKKKGAPEVE